MDGVYGGRNSQATRSSPSADDFNDKMSRLKLHTELLQSFANRRYVLQEKQKELEQEFRDLQKRQIELDEDFQKLREECHPVDISAIELEREVSLKDALIPFVCAIQDAQLYFQLKDFVIQKYPKLDHNLLPCRVEDMLRKNVELRSKFGTILDFHFHLLSYSMVFVYIPGKKDSALTNPVYQLVHRSIQTDYIMDEDPMVELRKLMEFDPDAYDLTFRFARQPGGFLAQHELKTQEDASKMFCQLRESMVKKSEEDNNKAVEEKVGNMGNKAKYADVVRSMTVTNKAAEKGKHVKHAEVVNVTPVSNLAAKEKGEYVVDLVRSSGEEKATFAKGAKMHGRRKKGRLDRDDPTILYL